MWSAPVYVEERDVHVIMLDFEAFGQSQMRCSAHQSATFDTILFSLACLLSSTVLFNQRAVKLEDKSLEQLKMLLEIGRFISVRQPQSEIPVENTPRRTDELDNSASVLSSFLQPKLLWILRDFKDSLVDDSGHQITENEYLETKLQSFVKSSHRKFKQTRDVLTQFYQDRELVTMIQPCEQKEDLDKIDEAGFDILSAQFQEDIELLQFKVFQETPVKRIQSKAVNGFLFARMVTSFCDALNQQSVPNVNLAWDFAFKSYLEYVAVQALKLAKTTYDGLVLPMALGDLLSQFGQIQVTVQAMFIEVSKVCVTPLETEDLSIVTKETINEIKKLQENLTKRNKSMVFKQFDKIASKAFLDLQKENLNDGGSEKVQQMVRQLAKEIQSGVKSVPEDCAVLYLKEELPKLIENVNFYFQRQLMEDPTQQLEQIKMSITQEKTDIAQLEDELNEAIEMRSQQQKEQKQKQKNQKSSKVRQRLLEEEVEQKRIELANEKLILAKLRAEWSDELSDIKSGKTSKHISQSQEVPMEDLSHRSLQDVRYPRQRPERPKLPQRQIPRTVEPGIKMVKKLPFASTTTKYF